jgi:hypothetical protein
MIAINVDLIARGYVSSLAQPGGNATGAVWAFDMARTKATRTSCASRFRLPRSAIGGFDAPNRHCCCERAKAAT